MKYDGMGRLTAVWLPGRQTTASPSKRFTYKLVGVAPDVVTGSAPVAATPPNTYVQTETLREDGSYGQSFSEVDGLGEAVQTQATPADGSPGTVVTDQRYDSLGRVFKTFAAHWDGGQSPGGQWLQFADATIPSETVTTFDGMSRPLTVTQESSGSPIPGVVTTTAYPGLDRTDVTGPTGNGLATTSGTSTFTDVRGRTTKSWTYHDADGKPIAPDGDPAHADITTYSFTYSPGGNGGTRTTITDATGKNIWSTDNADLVGHDVSATDPDTGTTTTLSDPAGLVLATADGRGQVLAYTYDNLNRKTGEYDGGTISDRSTLAHARETAIADPGRQLAAWTFDSLAKGQPDASIRYVGGASGNAYTTQVTGYDAEYKPTGDKTVIPGVEGLLAGTYQTTMSYTPNTGLLDHTTLPAAGNLPAETMQNTYNINGLLLTSSGKSHDVTDTQYDQAGKILSRTVGDYPYQVVQQNVYDPATQRVTNSFTDASAGHPLLDPNQLNTYGVDDVSYTYDAAGRVTSTADLQNWSVLGLYYPGAQSRDNQCFTYDYAGRLTNAWTDAGNQSPAAATDLTKPTAAVAGLGSCASSTQNNPPTAASAQSGQLTGTGTGKMPSPAAYWQSWTFDATGAVGLGNGAQTGNRSTQTDHNPFGDTSDDTTATSGFPAAGAGNTAGADTTGGTGPHLLDKLTRTGEDAGTDTYAYDGSGNTTSRKLAGGSNETLTWDAENRLAKVADSCTDTTAKYVYDANGNQLIRRDTGGAGAGATLFLGPNEIHLKHGLLWDYLTADRYFPQPNAPTRIESSDGPTTYEVANSQGTGDTVVDADTGEVTARRYTTPYGQARSAAPLISTWPDDHTFLGKTTDTSTGLVDIGARKYDPSIGRFISADPVLQSKDPQAIGGYAYSANDAVNKTDPSGLTLGDMCHDGGGHMDAGKCVYPPDSTNIGGGSDDPTSGSDFSSCGDRAIWLNGVCLALPPEQNEDKNRPWNVASAGWEDRVRMYQLAGVRAYMSAMGRQAATDALGHWLANTGGYGVVDPRQMMSDLPWLSTDIGLNVPKSGHYDSGWKSESVGDHMNANNPTSKEADWFYALNSFQYRVYGDVVTVDGQPHGTMTIEIYKRYNWGNISGGQPRNPLPAKVPVLGTTLFTLSQNDLAHLNTVGLAQDYDVVGVATGGF